MRTVLLLIVSACLIAACAPTPAAPALQAPAAAPAATHALTHLFDYSKVSEYDYRSTGYLDNQTLVSHYKHVVNAEMHNGIDTWHITAEFSVEGAPLPPGSRGYSEFWFDKKTESCVDQRNVIVVDGKTSYTKGICGPTTTLGNAPGVSWPYYRDTQVTLPIGKIDAGMYGIEGAALFFISTDYGVPVMITLGKGTPGPGTTYFELERYVPS